MRVRYRLMTPSPSNWIYQKWMGWYEYSSDNEKIPVICAVYSGGFGYNVFILGVDIDHMARRAEREDAIEYAVDAVRELAADHEMSQYDQN